MHDADRYLTTCRQCGYKTGYFPKWPDRCADCITLYLDAVEAEWFLRPVIDEEAEVAALRQDLDAYGHQDPVPA